MGDGSEPVEIKSPGVELMGRQEHTEFKAYLPAIQSAIKWHGSGDSVRFQLEVPRQELAGFLPMLEWTQGLLRVTVEPVEVAKNDDDRPEQTKAHF